MGSIFHCFSLLPTFLTAMVVIAETSDDGSNGGDPPKKPQEQVNRSFTWTIPNDVIETCVAMLPRCHYPTLTIVSRYFGDLMASPVLYKARSQLNTTESVLYGFIGLPPLHIPRCFILHQGQLRIIDSLPPMPFGSAVVTIGHEMYVIGGCNGYRAVDGAFIIDCRTHKTRKLPSMNKARYRAAAGVIDGKIYVIGGSEKRLSDWVEVFDVKGETWSNVSGPYPLGNQKGEFKAYAVMGEKIYVSDRDSCFSYEPKNGKWELCERLRDFWRESSCVVDDMLYTIGPLQRRSCAIVYDSKEKNWVAVKGVVGLPQLQYYDSKMADFGGKLMILGASERYADGDGEKDIWCVEIALERRRRGEFSGKIESAKPVLTSVKLPSIELCRTVTI